MAEPAPDVLATHALGRGSKVAVVDDRPGGPVRRVTFAELNTIVNQLANALLAAGLTPDDRLGWCGQNALEVIATLHAARKAGIGSVPINYRLSADEAAYVIDDSDAVAVVVDAERAPLLEQIADRLPKVRLVVVFAGPERPSERDRGPEREVRAAGNKKQIAYDDFVRGASPEEPHGVAPNEQVIYTSGTTGRPKGAVRRGSGDPRQVLGLVQLLGAHTDDVHLTTGPLYHSGPLAFFTLAHGLGNTVVVQHHFDAEDWLRLVDRYRVSTTFAAPAPIRMVCNLPDSVKDRYDRSSMRALVANAAPWSMTLKEAYLADFPEDSLFEVYGATELGVITVLQPAEQRAKPGSCGRPAPYVEVSLVDDMGHEITATGVPGELYVRASSVISTYHNAPEKYAEEHRGEWHTVGDIAYRDDEGFLYICDRKKDMVISGGVNIYPAEIEAVLEKHPGVFDVAVIGVPSEEWDEAVHAVIVRLDPSLTEAEVLRFARDHLAGYKVPKTVAFVDELPRTGSGKILKRELRSSFGV
jgi:fatty-acyl-CoA synthase/long-chain acyl-CoA synthetase